MTEAMKWAPRSTRSHLQEYPNQVPIGNLAEHSGLSLAFDSVLHSWLTSSTKSNKKLQNSETSRFVSVLCLRSKYAGEISGLLSVLSSEEKKGLADKLVSDIWEACVQKDNEKHRGAVWRAAGYLILCSGINRKLLHAISTSHVELFTTAAMETAVEVWQWIITSRQDLELCFIQEMVGAWQTTFDKRMGLFTLDSKLASPLATYDGCKLVPEKINIMPHLIWLQLISEMVDTAKYCNRDKVEMFCMLLHRSLPMTQNAPQFTRNVMTVGCRFKFLQCGLSLLQGNIITKSIARNILRERIYYYALDYFCSEQMCPSQSRDELYEDIIILIKFWQTMRSEKKHLVASELSDYDLNPSSQNISVSKQSDNISTAGSEFGRVSNTGTGTGWYNTITIPHSTSTLSKKSGSRSKRLPFFKDSYDRDYMKKRNLILELLAAEIEFLIIWYNPLSNTEMQIPGEDSITEWRARPVKLNMWRDYTRLAWANNPALAVFLPHRQVISITFSINTEYWQCSFLEFAMQKS